MLKNFKSVIKKELIIYSLTLLVLTLIVHSDLVSDPSSRMNVMYEKGNYAHPFLYSFVVYSVILILRKTIDFITSIFEKK